MLACVALTASFFIAKATHLDLPGVIMATLTPMALLAVFWFVFSLIMVTDDNDCLEEEIRDTGKLWWPLFKTLAEFIKDGFRLSDFCHWLKVDKTMSLINDKVDDLFEWLKDKWSENRDREDYQSEKDLSWQRVSALLVTCLLTIFVLTIGVKLFLWFLGILIAISILSLIVDIPIMIFIRIATGPALAAGEGAAFAITLEGLLYREFNAGSAADWTRLVIFAVIGCFTGLGSYALRQHLLHKPVTAEAE